MICFNPEAAQRDKHIRGGLLARLTDTIADSDKLNPTTCVPQLSVDSGHTGG